MCLDSKNAHGRDARNSFYLGELRASALFYIHKEGAYMLLHTYCVYIHILCDSTMSAEQQVECA